MGFEECDTDVLTVVTVEEGQTIFEMSPGFRTLCLESYARKIRQSQID